MVFVGLIEDNATDINEKECDRGYCIEKDNFVFYHAGLLLFLSHPIEFRRYEGSCAFCLESVRAECTVEKAFMTNKIQLTHKVAKLLWISNVLVVPYIR